MSGYTEIKMSAPDHLEWVYIYIDAYGNAGYVGRAKSTKNCYSRLRSHRKEHWYSTKDWWVIFWPCVNRCESEYIETILINLLHPLWNVDKVDWGLLTTTFPNLDDLPIYHEMVADYPNIFYQHLEPIEKEILENIKRDPSISEPMQVYKIPCPMDKMEAFSRKEGELI